jgi:hypothetical protein
MFGSVILRFPLVCFGSEVAAFEFSEFSDSGKGVDIALLFRQTEGALLSCSEPEPVVLGSFSDDFGSASSSTIEEGPPLLSTREGASRTRGGSSSLKGSRN